jgi:outer membrane receptor protein involved in Fe transport
MKRNTRNDRPTVSYRHHALATVSTTALFLSVFAPHASFAQAAPQTAQAGPIEEVTITGTRIIRDGYQAPAPVTVVGVEQLQSSASSNIADFVNTMPAFSGSTAPASTNASMSQGTSGAQILNLRSLGAQRTLILLDGQRTVGINTSQNVDVNLIPQSLVSRVDVETGGASSKYGSDAVAGVVNFILDKNFTGVKGDFSGGVTTYGDDRQWDISLTGGTGFANDRGHFLINGEASHIDGVPLNNRPWNLTGLQFMNNPNYNGTNGQPQWLLRERVSPDNGFANGAIISDGPLKGIAFGPGGGQFPYTYGSLTFDPDTYNSPLFAATQCRGTACGGGLTSMETTQNLFTRISYDITDDVEVFVQASWAHNFNYNWCCTIEDNGNISISSGNPFIPANIQAQMNALGLSSIDIGTQNQDLPPVAGQNDRRTERFVVGGNGKVDAFDTTWTWNAYYQKGISYQRAATINAINYPNFYDALDAVRGPNGQIVCRSSLTAPNNGCVPYNVFGLGVNSQAAIRYVLGAGALNFRTEKFTQDVIDASASGSPFSNWAGPVSIAFGIDHRREHVHGINDPVSAKGTFDWWVGDYQVQTSSYSVTEGFVETDIPLAKDQAWAKSLDLNAAARFTGYSTSGYVTTWSVGGTWKPIDDIMFRANRSRDIRAPNLQELFAPGSGGFPGITNPFLGNITENNIPASTRGNPNLQPEKSDGTGLGVVLQPQFIRGLTVSVDYWNMDISGAIGTLQSQQIIDNCYAGNTVLCSAINFRPDKYILSITNEPFNLVQRLVSGIDFDGTYTLPLADVSSNWDGNLTFHASATRFIENWYNDGIDPAINSVGTNSGQDPNLGPPRWRYQGSVTYANDPITVAITGRGVSGGTYDNSYVTCTSGCPASSGNHITVDNNHIEGAFYIDTSITYKIMRKADGADVSLYFNVQNLANKDPAIVAQQPGGYNYSLNNDNGYLYDVLGRVFRAGVRFRM